LRATTTTEHNTRRSTTRWRPLHSLGRVGTAEEVADTVAFHSTSGGLEEVDILAIEAAIQRANAWILPRLQPVRVEPVIEVGDVIPERHMIGEPVAHQG
jgi:hypothetical protein